MSSHQIYFLLFMRLDAAMTLSYGWLLEDGGMDPVSNPYEVPADRPYNPSLDSRIAWVAVKELNLSYYIGETLLFTISTHYGNFI